MILGQPKNIEDIPPLTVNTIRQFAEGMRQQLASGHPLDVPTMMPMGQLMQFARTLEAYLDVAEKAVAVRGDDMDDIIAQLNVVAEEAQALLDTPEPPPPPRIQPASGPLIIPK